MWALTCICRVRNHALLIIHEWLLMQKKQIFEFKCHSLASQDGFVKELLFLSVLICHRIMFTLMILTVDDTWALPSVGSSYFTSPNPNHQPPPAFFLYLQPPRRTFLYYCTFFINWTAVSLLNPLLHSQTHLDLYFLWFTICQNAGSTAVNRVIHLYMLVYCR